MLNFAHALCDLWEIFNLIPLFIFKKLGLGGPKSTGMRLLITDITVKSQIGILYDVLVKEESLIFPIEFVIRDIEVDF